MCWNHLQAKGTHAQEIRASVQVQTSKWGKLCIMPVILSLLCKSDCKKLTAHGFMLTQTSALCATPTKIPMTLLHYLLKYQ